MGRTRSILAGLTTVLFLGAIAGIFWFQDVQYSLPTPRPVNWHRVATGTRVALPADVESLRRSQPGKPLFLHFFNPSCPCSRFNVDHVRELVAAFGTDVIFVAVLSDGEPEALRQSFRALNLAIPYHVDNGTLAEATGVYSTPQAAIVDGNGRLFYQGNYNVTRYCRNRETEFARLALQRLRIGAPPPDLMPAATVAYGCPLPPHGRTSARAAL